MWVLKDAGGRFVNCQFERHAAAVEAHRRLPRFVRPTVRVVHESGNVVADRMLTEGLVKGDLARILLPRISIDEYVPASEDRDNVVIGFYLKGVPEAVLPFRNFLDRCNGVLRVDYGDRETIPNTSVIYVEMSRPKLRVESIADIVELVAMLAQLQPEDFTLVFPNTKEKFPFDIAILKAYFRGRSRRENFAAQQQAQRIEQPQGKHVPVVRT